MQERLISPRNIYFGAETLYWECCEDSLSESFPVTMPSGGTRPSSLKVIFEGVLKPITAKQPEPGRVTQDYFQFLEAWHTVLIHYTGTDLTHTTDRLLDLAGIAKAIQHRTNLNYLAGI